MTSSANATPNGGSQGDHQVNVSTGSAQGDSFEVLYRERQWVPWYWWLFAAFVAALTGATIGINRHDMWPYITFVIAFAILGWGLYSLSGTVLQVEKDEDGIRWLTVKDAQLPHDIISRSLAVPKSARRSALGPQLDPAAFLISHQWVDELVMLVLDDPEDPTPYWLVSSKDPEALLRALVPEQADQAIKNLKS